MTYPGYPMIPTRLSGAQAEAVEDCFHNSDLIGRTPLPCEIEWALRVRTHVSLDTHIQA